jgi:WD40 repeat protein
MSREALVDIEFYCVPNETSACRKIVQLLNRAMRRAPLRVSTRNVSDLAPRSGPDSLEAPIAVLLIDCSAETHDQLAAIRAATTAEDAVLPVLLTSAEHVRRHECVPWQQPLELPGNSPRAGVKRILAELADRFPRRIPELSGHGRLRRSIDWFEGYDFFISYSWADARPMAQALHAALTDRGLPRRKRFRCFLDSGGFRSGERWRAAAIRAAASASEMILLVTPGSMSSTAVRDEVMEFRRLNKPITPISADNSVRALRNHALIGALPDDLLWIHKPIAAEHAPELANELTHSFRRTRRQVLALRVLSTALAFVTLLMIAASLLAYAAYRARNAERLAREDTAQSLYRNQISGVLSNYRLHDARSMMAVLDNCDPARIGFEWRHLRWLSDSSEFELPAGLMAVSRDGQRLYVLRGTVLDCWSTAGAARYWSVQLALDGSYDAICEFTGRNVVAVHPAGSAGAVLLEAETGCPLGPLGSPDADALRFAFAPAAGRIGLVRDDGIVIETLGGHSATSARDAKSGTLGCKFDPTGEVFAAWSNDRMTLYHASNGAELGQWAWNLGRAYSAALDPDGTRIAIHGPAGVVVQSIRTGEELFRANDPSIKMIEYRDSRHICALTDKTLDLYDVDQQRPVVSAMLTNSIAMPAYAIDGRGRCFAAADAITKTTNIWDLQASGSPIRTLPVDAPDRLWFLSESNEILVQSQNAIEVFGVAHGSVQRAVQVETGVLDLAANALGTRAVALYRDKVSLLDLAAGEIRWTIEFPEFDTARIAISDDGELIAFSLRNRMRIFDAATGRVEVDHTIAAQEIESCRFAPADRLVAWWDGSSVAFWRPGMDAPAVRSHPYVGRVLFAGKGRWLATGSQTECRVWSRDQFERVAEARWPGEVGNIGFSLDGSEVLACSTNFVAGFRPESQTISFVREWNAGDVGNADVGPHGDRALVTAWGPVVQALSDNSTIRTWSRIPGEPARRFEQPYVYDAEFVGESGLILSQADTITGDPTLALWNTASGSLEWRALSGSDQAQSRALLANGKLIAGSQNGSVHFIDLSTRTIQKSMLGCRGPVTAVAGSQDGRVICATDDQRVRLWRPDRVEQDVHLLMTASDRVRATAVNSRGDRIVVCEGDRATVWDVRRWSRIADLTGPFKFGAATSNGAAWFVTVGAGAAVWNWSDGALRSDLRLEPCFPNEVLSVVAVAPAGDWIVAGGDGGELLWWRGPNFDFESLCPDRLDDDGAIRALAISPDGARMAAAVGPKRLRIFEGGSSRELLSIAFDGDDGWAWSAAFSPDGRTIAVGFENRIRFWDAATGERRQAGVDAEVGAIAALAFSPESDRLLAGDESGKVHVWRWPALDLLCSFGEHRKQVTTLSFAPDGSLWSGSQDGRVLNWPIRRETAGAATP